MKININTRYLQMVSLVICLLGSQTIYAQEIDFENVTKEEIVNMSYAQLLEMEFEDVMKLATKMGVSMDELYEMLLNKDVSSASKKVESSFEAPLSTTVLSNDEIVASGARNIEEALRLVPGMIVREKTTGNFDIHIRGFDNVPSDNLFLYSENSLSLVMIDGRQVYNYVNGGTFWETLPVDIADVDRIEVVRGPASALYGANAASGVINIITKQPDSEKLGVNGSYQMGSLATKIANLSLGQSVNEKFGYRVSGNYQYMERTTDKLYALDLDSMFAVPDLFSLADPSFPWLKVTAPRDGDGSVKYANPHKARDRWAVNGFIFYEPSKNLSTRLSFGKQYSDVLTSTFGDQVSPLSTRISNTSYVDLQAKTYGFNIQANYNFGWQNIIVGDEGFKVDMNTFNSSLEYDAQWKNLSIRPGIYYQETTQNDLPYLSEPGKGFLNDKRSLNVFSGSLRADYKIADFRLIGALRAEKYNVNDNMYLPFQLTASYNLKDKHFFRINYGRANRSPFLADTYANYNWDREARSFPSNIHFKGKENLNLAKVDMIEVGYRVKPAKNIQVDIEAFYAKAQDFGYLSPDSVVGNFSLVDSALYNYNHPIYGPIKILQPVPAPGIPETVQMAYQNTEIISIQKGITVNLGWVVNEDLMFKFYGTYQETKLENYYPYSTDEIIGEMTMQAGASLQQGQNIIGPTQTTFFQPAGFDPYPSMLAYSSTRPGSTVAEKDHKATPSFYGGFSVDYKALKKKLRFFVSSYFYSEQELQNQYGTYDIPAKFLLNTKVSYKVYKNNALFFNARNMLNNSSAEFATMDQTQGIYMAGIDIQF